MGAWRCCLLVGSVLLTLSAQSALGQVTVNIGTLPAGKSVTITFDAQINSPLPPGTTQLSQQGTLTGDTFSTVLSDDPTTAAVTDPTLTRIGEALGGGGTIFPTPVPPAEIPTLSQWGVLLLALVLLLLGGRRLYAQSRTQRWLWVIALLGLLGTTLGIAQQSLPTVTLTDQLLSDQNGNGRIDAGDLLRYRARITNPGPNDLMNVVFTLTLDPNTTLVSGSLNTSPLALNQTVFVTLNTPLAITLTGSDAESEPLTFTITDDPQDGSLSGTPPNLLYTPDTGFTGTDTLRFRTNDGKANSNEEGVITFMVTTNAPPTATAQTVSTAEDLDLPLTLTGTDPESQPLTFAVATNPSHGSLSGTPPNVTYSPTLNYHGPDSFTFTAHDGSTTSAPATITITVTPVNDPPLAAPANVTTNEGSPVDILLVGTDVDNDPLTFSIVANPTNGSLSGTPPNVTYTPNANFTGDDSFSFTVNDGTVDSNTALVSVTVVAVNDPPVLTAGNTLAYTENDPATVLDPTVTVSDVDSVSLTSATVQITGNYQNGQDVLSFVNTPNITGSFTAATGTLTLTGTDTLSNYEAALRSVTYQNTSDTPTTLARTVTWIGNDGTSDSLPVTSTINVTAINDAPVNTVPGAQATSNTVALTFSTANGNALSSSDVDAGGADVQLTLSVPTGKGTLTLATTTGLTFTTGDGTNDETITATGTLTAINTALDGLVYTPPVPVISEAVLLTFTVNDQGNTGAPGAQSDTDTVTISVDGAPTVTTATPSSSTTQVALTANIVLTFSENVNIASSAVTLNCGSAVAVTTTPVLPATNTGTLTIDPSSNLPEGTSCIVTVDSTKVTDTDSVDPPNELDGNADNDGADGDVDNYVLTFTMDDAPTVTSTTPTSGATGVALNTDLTVNFSESVNATAASFTLDCGGGALTYALSGTPATAFTLNPNVDLPAGATCTVTMVSAQITDTDAGDPPNELDGNNNNDGTDGDVDNSVFSFQTDTAPTVTTRTPAASAVVATTQTLTIGFSENVNLTANAVTLNCGGPVSLSGLPASNTNSVTLTPSSLPAGSSCTVTVVAAEVSDSDTVDPPDTMTADDSWTFSVDAAPSVTGTTPAGGATNQDPTGTITINFSESVAFSTVANAANTSFDLECPSGTPADFTVVTASPATSVVLNPQDSAIAGQSCVLTVRAAGIADSDSIDPPNNLAADVTATIGFRSLANDDSYSVTPHLTLSATSGTQGEVDANDFLGTGALTGFGPSGTCAAQVPNGTNFVTTGGGGRVVLNLDGSFGYIPPAGASNTIDSFCYTVTGGDTATVTFNIANTELVWFVDAAYGGANGASNGTQGRPFTTLAGATTSDTLNDTIFVEFNASAYTCGISLLDGELLIGKGSGSNLGTLTGITPVSGSAFPALGGSNPTLTAGADCVTVGSNNTIRGISFGNVGAANTVLSGTNFGTLTVNETDINTNGRALNLNTGTFNATFSGITSTGGANNISLNTIAGTSTLGSGALSGATGTNFLIDGGSATVSYAGTITDDVGALVTISNTTGGSKTFSGAITDGDDGDGSGITLTNNTGATITFSGGLTLSTGANPAFTATGGGTVTVCDENPCNPAATGALVNKLTTTTATALNVTNTTIGTNKLEFRSISANGAPNGIVLNNTGTTAGTHGGLTVTGTGTTDGTGGTIQNTTTRGASFISARDIILENMNFTNAATVDFPAAPTGLSLGNNTADNAAIHLQGVTNAILDNLNITGSAEQGINGHNVNGFTLSNSTITNAGNGPDEDGLHFYNMVGTSSITNTTITSSGDDNVNIQNNNNLPGDLPQSTTGTITVTGGSFNTGVLGSGLLFGIRGTMNTTINISGVTLDNNFSGGVVADNFDTATMDLDVTTSTIINNNDAIAVSSNNGNAKFDIHDNTNLSLNDFAVISVLKAAFSTTGTLEGRIHNNPITVANGRPTDAIVVFNAGAGALKLAITNNVIDYAGTQRAILIQSGQDGSGSLDTTVTGNSVDIELDGVGNAVAGILAQTAITGPGNTSSLCADIGGAGGLSNTFTHSLGGALAAGDIRVRQRNDGTVRLPGYGGGATDTAAVVAYLNGRNVEVSSSTATANSTGFAGGGACQQPVFP